MAIGFTKIFNTYYLTDGKSIKDNNVNLININEINDEFLDTIDFVLLIRETNIINLLKRNKSIEKMFFNKNRKQKTGIKGDAIVWLHSKAYHGHFSRTYKVNFVEFVINSFDIICCQTNEFKRIGLKDVKRRYPKYYNDIEKIMFVSRMGVPNFSPIDETIENPYCINHSYCFDNFTQIKKGRALHPFCYTTRNTSQNPTKRTNYNIPKIKLIYMGRIRTDRGKILLHIREIMKKLGEAYELHVFPGRFTLPYCNIAAFSSKYPENLQMLRETMFYDCPNVIIHFPFDDETKSKFLQHIDIGIDFSSSRPANKLAAAGNAKLLEYCYYGIKVVTEKNVNNSHLVDDGKNGCVLDGIASINDYVEAIKKTSSMIYDKEFTIQQTIKTNNWDLIATEFEKKFMSLIEPSIEETVKDTIDDIVDSCSSKDKDD